jgi:hypothetical protein
VDQADEPLGGISDTSITPTAEDFDLDAWLNGARPVRRSVTLYSRGDLIARLEQLATLIEQCSDEDRPSLEDEAEHVQRDFLASGQVFTVEARSSEWVNAYRDACVKQGLKLGDKSGTEKDRTQYALQMLAEQIVVPSGMTYAKIKRLADIAEPEVMRLVSAQVAANSRAATSVDVVTRDFSQGRSGATPR